MSGDLAAGQPELRRAVAFDPAMNAWLEARWDGLSHEDPPPEQSALSYYVYLGKQQVADLDCDTIYVNQETPKLSWRAGQEIRLPKGECTASGVASRIPGLSLKTEKGPHDRAQFRVRRPNGSKKISATQKERAVLEYRRANQWVVLQRFESYAVPVISEVFSSGQHRVIVVRLDIPKSALGIPSSREEVFIEARNRP